MKTMQTSTIALAAMALASNSTPLSAQVSFGPRADYGNITGATVSTVADFNNDRLPDIAVGAGSPGTLDIFLGEGAGYFQTTPISLGACPATDTAGQSNAVTMADLNGDGVPDVIISCNSGNTVSVFLSLTPSVFLQTSQGNAIVDQNITLTAVVGSPSQGFLYVTGYSVEFYDGNTAIGSASLSGGQAALTISTLAQGIHYITAALSGPNGNAIATSGAITEVISRTGCATNDTAKLEIVPGDIRHNRTTDYTRRPSPLPIPRTAALTVPWRWR
jgi:hypothetical protein